MKYRALLFFTVFPPLSVLQKKLRKTMSSNQFEILIQTSLAE